jgi:hypothetical protein
LALLLLWKDNIVENFAFVLHSQQALRTLLSNSLHTGIMDDKPDKGRKRTTFDPTKEAVGAAWEAITRRLGKAYDT